MAILCLILVLCSEFLMPNGLHAKVIRSNKLDYKEYTDYVYKGSQEYLSTPGKVVMDLTSSDTTTDSPTLSTTQECDCGPYTKECKLIGYRKDCTCQDGYSSNFQKCEKCDCGIYSKSCTFGWYSKMCDCLEGYIERNGTCTKSNSFKSSTITDSPTIMPTTPECDCGKYSKSCSLRWYGKSCNCLEGYADRNGTCTSCDCGRYSERCDFNSDTYKKECICKQDYSERLGTCIACDCGRNSKSCKYMYWNKQCECQDGYSQYNNVCKECDCGSHSKSCEFGAFGKVCRCEKGYENKNGTCTECNCGENSFRCSFYLNGTKRCSCRSNYAQNKDICSALCFGPSGCTNGTICTEGEGGKHFCECPPYFRGEMCEISVLCEEIERTCRAMAAVCVLKDSGAYCECPPGKKVDLQSGLCTDICNPSLCVHGKCEVDELSYSCKCEEGYTGLHCDKVIKTKSNNSILWMVALISVNTFICVMLCGIFCLLCCKRK